MFRKILKGCAALGIVACGLAILNFSALWSDDGVPVLLAHRGMAQQFSREGLTNETCTAARMLPTGHDYLENTIPSMRRAFELGADIVEIDIHPTTDGEFAVFHDWTIDCRTNGKGVTREQSMAYLRTLDIGFGYTADNGMTFPFRGQHFGAMPSLKDVLAAFPQKRFLINIKSDDDVEADLLAAYLGAKLPDGVMFFGGDRPIARLRALYPDARLSSYASLRRCVKAYVAFGWFGYVPKDCRNAIVFVPINYRLLMAGWPNLLVARLRGFNSELFMVGRYSGASSTGLIDDPAMLEEFAAGYAGGISTDRIDVMGPWLMKAVVQGKSEP